jgi:hypothetical protein
MKAFGERTTDELLDELRRRGIYLDTRGGVVEASSWQGDTAAWSRRELRSERVAIAPHTVEGLWFAVAAIRGFSRGMIRTGFDDAGVIQVARALSKKLDGWLDLYDS